MGGMKRREVREMQQKTEKRLRRAANRVGKSKTKGVQSRQQRNTSNRCRL